MRHGFSHGEHLGLACDQQGTWNTLIQSDKSAVMYGGQHHKMTISDVLGPLGPIWKLIRPQIRRQGTRSAVSSSEA